MAANVPFTLSRPFDWNCTSTPGSIVSVMSFATAIEPLLQTTYGLLITVHVVLVMIELQMTVFVACAGLEPDAARAVVKVKPPNTNVKLTKMMLMKRFTVHSSL